DDCLFIGTNQNELQIRSFPYADIFQSIVHFNQPVSTLYISQSLLFIGRRDSHVAMINLNDDSKSKKYFIGHQFAILALNVHEENNLLALSSIDGSVRFINLIKYAPNKNYFIITYDNQLNTFHRIKR
ncbi:unnamed protein product, partial [Rotaria sp. Silwood1]